MPFPLLIPLLAAAAPAIGSMLSGAGRGAATERGAANTSAQNANQLRQQQFGTQQNALTNQLIARGNEATNRYGTRQGATTNAMQGLQGATSRALESQSGEGLERAKLGMSAPRMAARDSILGSLMKNMQPLNIQSAPGQRGHETKLSGGMSAANLDPMTREHGAALIEDAMNRQRSGHGIPGATDFKGGIQDWKSSILDVPEATDYSKGLLAPPEMQGYQKAGGGESLMSGLGMGAGILGQLLSAANAGGGTPPYILNNQAPSPYTGMNMAGVPNDFQLPRGALLGDDTFVDE